MYLSTNKSSQENKPPLSEALQFLTQTLLKTALHHTYHPYFFDKVRFEYKFSEEDIQKFQDITAQYAAVNPVFQALANDLLKDGYKWCTHKNQKKRITRADQYEELGHLLQKAGIDFDRRLNLTDEKGNVRTHSDISPYMNQLSDRELSFYREPACTYIYNVLKDEIFKVLPNPEELRKKKRFIKLSEELEKRELMQSLLWDLTDTAYNLRMLPYKPEDPDFAVKLANELGKRWYYNELEVRTSQIRLTDDSKCNPENDPNYFKTHLNRLSELHLHNAYAHSLAEHPYDYYRNEALLLQNTGYDFDPCNISELNHKSSYLQHLEEARQQILQDTKQYAEENDMPFDPQKMNRFFDALTHTELENSRYPVNKKYPLMENSFTSDFPSESMNSVIKTVQTADLKEKLNKERLRRLWWVTL